MRRFLIITLAIAFIFSVCAVPVSAASYDLGSPSWFGSYATTALDEDYEFHSIYYYDRDSGEVSASTGVNETIALAYFPNGKYESNANWITTPAIWSFRWLVFPALPEPRFALRSTGYNPNTSVLGFQYTNPFVENIDNLDKLFFPAIIYNDLFIPSSGQYFKVSFEFDTIQTTSMPSALNYLMDLQNFAFLGSGERTDLVNPFDFVFPATVTVSKITQRTYKYTYYFNVSGNNFANLSDNLSLVLRFPYFSGGDNLNYSASNLQFLTNASIPTQYEILTVGGYDQELKSIENAIISSNQQLIDIYTNETDSDKTYVIQLENSNSQLDQGIKDYQSAAAPVEQIRDQFIAPPLKDLVYDNLDDLQTAEVKDLFSLPWLISAIGIVFSFAIIRVILYGTKE